MRKLKIKNPNDVIFPLKKEIFDNITFQALWDNEFWDMDFVVQETVYKEEIKKRFFGTNLVDIGWIICCRFFNKFNDIKLKELLEEFDETLIFEALKDKALSLSEDLLVLYEELSISKFDEILQKRKRLAKAKRK